MRQADLELYRWKVHNQIYVPSMLKHKPPHSLYSWWSDYAAFTSVLPRQTGKTNMLSILVNEFKKKGEKYIIMVPNVFHKQAFRLKNDKHVIPAKAIGVNGFGTVHNGSHLLVDEFMFIDRKIIRVALSINWKTVTMVGSLPG